MSDYADELESRVHQQEADGTEVCECRECSKEFQYRDGYGGNNEDVEFCSEGCWQNYQERMYERQLEDYYGGSTPQTDRERYIDTWEEKRGLR